MLRSIDPQRRGKAVFVDDAPLRVMIERQQVNPCLPRRFRLAPPHDRNDEIAKGHAFSVASHAFHARQAFVPQYEEHFAWRGKWTAGMQDLAIRAAHAQLQCTAEDFSGTEG